ncbi:YheC/YheD family protein [Bacillus sp. B15-48]|uniref:YheC/YheD family protein n=1 Tax=Bacillus sp. B15-48 TaxID=1548601 RepID=UPI00193F99CF|nr:YheC/YheD family protein [Bacillus sp. B15-48]MBM4762204.1 hypothetical protein [Bacillus sp. B15-48]
MKFIGIMTLSKKARKKFLDYFLPYNDLPDVTLFAFTPKGINWRKKRVNGVYKQNGDWKTKRFPFPDCVINQSYTTSVKTVKKLERALGTNKVFNRVNRLSKWLSYEALANSELNRYVSETWKLEEISISELLNTKESLYFKPEWGTLGRGIFKLTTDESGFHIFINNTKPKFSCHTLEEILTKITELTGDKKYIIQKEIKPLHLDDKEYFEVRIILQKGYEGMWGITTALARRVFHSSIIANLAFKVEPLEKTLQTLSWSEQEKTILLLKMRQIALLAAPKIEKQYGHMGEMGVDLMVNETGEIKIIEVNARPSKKMIERLRDDSLQRLFFSNPIHYAHSLIYK